MIKFHPLVVADKRRETRDSVRLTIDIPSELREEFTFRAGQHLPFQIEKDGRKIRRTYSICSEQDSFPLQVGIRIQSDGQFSQYVDHVLNAGDSIEVMRPNGQFHVDLDSEHRKFYLGFAAGSGITPVLSIMASILKYEPLSRFALFYGNRKQSTTMFIDDLYALKNRYPERLQLHFLFSQEEQEFDVASGRLDGPKVNELYTHFCPEIPDEVFVCGPDSMIETVGEALGELSVEATKLHSERFGAPRKAQAATSQQAASEGDPATNDLARVTVVMDGHKKSFSMPHAGSNIVDAAAKEGVDLPYSCKGGVCATCRTHVRDGEVRMAVNYGLEPWEVEAGFVLACQSEPVSNEIVLDYDKT